MSADEVTYSTTQVAEMMGVTDRTVRRWVHLGYVVPIITPTGRYRWPASLVQRLLTPEVVER